MGPKFCVFVGAIIQPVWHNLPNKGSVSLIQFGLEAGNCCIFWRGQAGSPAHICVNPIMSLVVHVWKRERECERERESDHASCNAAWTPPPQLGDKAICVKRQQEEDGPQSNEVLKAAGSKWRLTEARRMQPQCWVWGATHLVALAQAPTLGYLGSTGSGLGVWRGSSCSRVGRWFTGCFINIRHYDGDTVSMIYDHLKGPVDYVKRGLDGNEGPPCLKFLAAVNYFPFDSLSSFSKWRRVSEFVCV